MKNHHRRYQGPPRRAFTMPESAGVVPYAMTLGTPSVLAVIALWIFYMI